MDGEPEVTVEQIRALLNEAGPGLSARQRVMIVKTIANGETINLLERQQLIFDCAGSKATLRMGSGTIDSW